MPAVDAQAPCTAGSNGVRFHRVRPIWLNRCCTGTAEHQRHGLIDVSLDAYGFSGPWKARRGFDSIVQMSMGFAEQGPRLAQADKPVPLPVQALDHATGYLMATAVLRALAQRTLDGRGSIVRASLARTGALLMAAPRVDTQTPAAPETEADWSPETEHTVWGPARRLRWPLQVQGVDATWASPATALGSSDPVWTT